MSQTWAPTSSWEEDQSGGWRKNDHGGWYKPEMCSTSPFQVPPSPNGFPHTMVNRSNLHQAQPWRQPTWNFSEAPQYHLGRNDHDVPGASYGQWNTGQPTWENTTPPPTTQNNPFRQGPKTPAKPHPSSWQAPHSPGSGQWSSPSSAYSPFNPFLEKRKKLQERHPTFWRPLDSPQDSETIRRDSMSPQQSPTSYNSEYLRESGPVAGAAPAQTCVSCADDLPADDFSETTLTQSCQHTNSACKDCVKQWVVTRLEDGSWDKIKCLECNEMMQYADVQQHADPEVFQRYDLLAARSWLNSEEDFIWCRNEGCGSGQVHEGGKNMPLFQCIACKTTFCIVHEVPWQEGETCAAFDRRLNVEEPLEEGEPVNATTAHQFGSEAAQEYRSAADFVHMNDRQERKLYYQAKERRTTPSDAQLTEDFAAALALEYADDDAPEYIFNSTNPWAEPSSSGCMPSMSHEWARQFSAPRATMSPPPVQASMSRRGFMQKFLNRRSEDSFETSNSFKSDARQTPAQIAHDSAFARKLQRRSGFDAFYGVPDTSRSTHNSAFASKLQRQSTDDASYARNLQKQFEQEDRDRHSAAEHQARHQRSIREAEGRAARHQAAKDASAAQALQKQFERDERDRVQQRQRDQEREAYQRRKAEEKQGEQTVSANAKRCPKCRWYIQKNDGCDHVSKTMF